MKILALARLALIELWRHKLAFLPIGLAGLLALIAFLPEGEPASRAVDAFTYDIAVTILPVFGAFVGVLAGGGLLAGEVERGTAMLLVTKPVGRAGVVAGKALGAFGFVIGAFALWALVLGAVSALRFPPPVALGVALATLGCALEACLYTAIAIAASTRLPATGAIAVAGLAWFAVVLAGAALKFKAFVGAALVQALAQGLRTVVPSEHLGAWPTLLAAGTAPTTVQVIALIAIPAWLGVAAIAFSTRDLG